MRYFCPHYLRETLVSPYMKSAPWKVLSEDSSSQTGYLSALNILPANKALFSIFSCEQNCADHGEFQLYYAPLERMIVSDKDIVASFASVNVSQLAKNTCDGRFVEQSERLSNQLIAPYFNTGNNQIDYLVMVNNSSAVIPFTMVLRDSNQNTCNIPQDSI
jgi:hypothetical protein